MAKLKDKRVKLDPDKIEWLLWGTNLDLESPFKSEGEEALCWKENKEYILSFRGPRSEEDDGTFYGAKFPHGYRPAAWWKFEHTAEEGWRNPRFVHPWDPTGEYADQFAYLKKKGLLFLGEEEAYLTEQKRREEIRALMTLDDETGN